MVGYIDFQELKRQVSIEKAAEFLRLSTAPAGNHQIRAACPACKTGGDRAIVITPRKGLFYCFSAAIGGDAIKLVAHVLGIDIKDAAQKLAGTVATVPTVENSTVSKVNATVPQGEKAALKPLDYLQADHELITSFGLSPETCQTWGAGYAPKGIMRGRFAIPIHDRQGVLLAYCGHTLRNESPRLIFPNGFDPRGVIFGADRIEEGPLYLVKEPIDVLVAFENAITNVVCFLTEVSAQSLETLASLMDERKCPTVEFFAN